MEARPDTSSSSGRFRGQWSFLANPPQNAQQQRSLPPSSYILHSERNSVSPLPTGFHYQSANGSRSSLPRNLTTASTAGRSVVSTVPSQPVLIRVHSADASAHTNPAPRPRRSVNMNKVNGLPAISEFSIQGILAAIQEDVEQDINTISEILGRSRLVLADQHDSHMPPQGEIRAMPYSLQAVEEASISEEQLAMDDVFILRDDASLVAESQAGSAAYGLLERLQAIPRRDRAESQWQVSSMQPTNRRTSTPMGTMHASPIEQANFSQQEPRYDSRNLLPSLATAAHGTSRATPAIVSEIHLLAEADGTGNHLHNHTGFEASIQDFDTDVDIPELTAHSPGSGEAMAATSFRDRMQNLLYVSDPTGLSVWLQGQSAGRQQQQQQQQQQSQHGQHDHSAESQLRGLLER